MSGCSKIIFDCLVPALLCVALPSGLAQADEWSFLRGSNFDGHASGENLVEQWSSEGPPVLWARELGQGFSGFTAKDDRVFTQYQSVAGQFVVCLDALSGEQVWSFRCDRPYEAFGLYPGPRSTPTLDGDKLYYTTPSGKFGSLRIDDGTSLWQKNLYEQFKSKSPDFGYACSAVIDGDLAVLPVGGDGSAIVAFNKQDGAVVWQSGTFEISYCSVLPARFSNRHVLIGYLKNDLVVLDSESGEVLGQKHLSDGYDEHSALPVYKEPFLWISAPFRNGSQFFKLEESNSGSLELDPVWRRQEMSNDVSSFVLVDGKLYGFDIFDVQAKVHRPSRGQFSCLDFAAGNVEWQNGDRRQRRDVLKPGNSNIAGHSSVIYADGKLILLNDTGELIILEASPKHYKELARATILGGKIGWTQPTLLDGKLFARNHQRAVCVYLGEPEQIPIAVDQAGTIADLPQEPFFDWAALVLSVEPEYSMDAPVLADLSKWFCVILIGSWLIVFPVAFAVGSVLKKIFQADSVIAFGVPVFRFLAFLSGVLGTTLLGRVLGEFVFTWPLALAVAFEAVVFRIRTSERNRESTSGPGVLEGGSKSLPIGSVWMDRITLAFFLVVCICYFYLCRRLSLAFEWSFLTGFPAALPFLLVARKVVRSQHRLGWLLYWLLTAVGFAAFYWVGAGVILVKY